MRAWSLIWLLLQVLPEGSPHQHMGSGHSRQAARIGMLAWQEMREGRGVMSSQLCNDVSGIADKIAVVKLPRLPRGRDAPGYLRSPLGGEIR